MMAFPFNLASKNNRMKDLTSRKAKDSPEHVENVGNDGIFSFSQK